MVNIDNWGNMNRIIFEQSEVTPDGRVTFGGTRAEHVLAVLHGVVGQTLKTGVVDGSIGTSTIEEIAPLPPDPATGLPQGRITVRVSHTAAAIPPWIDLVLAPPRPRAFKRLLPQLAALGVRRIVLVGAEKVEKAFWGAQALKPEIYRPLFLDGLMQAGVTAMPTISIEKSFRRYAMSGRLAADFPTSVRIVAHPGADHSPPPAPSVPSSPDELPLLAVGPEGGWTDDEIALLESLFFRRHSLGPRILRTDTAIIALLAQLMPLFERA